MKCDNCKHQILHRGYGPPDDYSMLYCAKEHWENTPPWELDEVEDIDPWENCEDYEEA